MSKTIISLFEDSVHAFRHNPLVWEKREGLYDYHSYQDIQRKALLFASGLIKMGLQKGERVALISEGCANWLVAELGVLYAGAINVPLSIKLNEEEVRFRLEHSDARFAISSKHQIAKVDRLLGVLPNLEKVIHFDAINNIQENVVSFDSVVASGVRYFTINEPIVEARYMSIQPNDYANICYTSGTTAEPKGIILTHRNYTANVEQALSRISIPSDNTALHILPWDHSFAHTVGLYIFIKLGASFAAVQTGNTPLETLKNIPLNIKEMRPHVLLSVPALARNFRKNIETGVAAKGPFVKGLFNFAMKVARTYNGLGFDKGKGVHALLRPLNWFFLKTLFASVRKNFGGRLKFFVGGGALLDIELQYFFYAIGIPMFQGYGLTEASPIISTNAPARHKLGSSGMPLKPMELKICDDEGNELTQGVSGEIVIRGENVMAGYWKNPQSTEETIRGGWLYTGDLGYIDEDGFLYVLGRNKSLLIADDGEKYSPELIEEAFIANSPYIDQCILYDNQNPYVVSVIVPNKEALKRYLKKHNLDVNSKEGLEAAIKLIQSELVEYRTGHKFDSYFPQRWLPATFTIADEPFTEQNLMVNSTMKVVRRNVEQAYEERIKFLYTPQAKDIYNQYNMNSMRNMLTQ